MPTRDQPPALLWFTRDLRLADQPALTAALASGRPVVACYVFDPQAGGRWAMGAASRWWLHHSLATLSAALDEAGIPLVLRRGDAAVEIARLAAELHAAELHAGQPVEPAARAALDQLEAALVPKGCAVHRHWTTLLFDPAGLRSKSGTPYTVFTPFSRACLDRGVQDSPLPVPRVATPPGPGVASDKLAAWSLQPTHPDWATGIDAAWQPGEAGARTCLDSFVDDALDRYDTGRDLPGTDGVSRLSPHLHWGELSPRTAWRAIAAHRGRGPQRYLTELLWREFCAHLLWHHPTLPDEPLRPAFARLPWRRDRPGLTAWQQGRTGIPIVDAGMRQLWQTGWQHNRVRMITASFLIKHLLIDWTEGEAWFWDCLVDADLASNSANWQWVAGCGADAAPFFRVFNPVLQGRKFDPDGAYVKRYVPELEKMDEKYIHAPWEAPETMLQTAGVTLGQTYPQPIVDLRAGRERALAAFSAVTGKAGA